MIVAMRLESARHAVLEEREASLRLADRGQIHKDAREVALRSGCNAHVDLAIADQGHHVDVSRQPLVPLLSRSLSVLPYLGQKQLTTYNL